MTKNNFPLVSVVIDTYNLGRFIEQAIISVFSQTYPKEKIELIVVDDGSSDDTRKKIEKYSDLIYLYKENGGQASAFNKAFEICNGEFIFLLDADDMMLPDRILKVVKEFNTYEEVSCVLNRRKFIVEDDKLTDSFPEFHNISINNETIDIIIDCQYGTSRTAVRKSVLEMILPIPETLRIEADLYLNLAIFWFGNISSLQEELTAYRIHGDNLFCIVDNNKLPLQISTMENALIEGSMIAEKSKYFDSVLNDKLLKPYQIEINDKRILLDIHNNKAVRSDNFKNEIEKLKLDWKKWNYSYKFYKILRLPLFLILSPEVLNRLKRFYVDSNIKDFREFLFKQ